jgi:hypothetical protein
MCVGVCVCVRARMVAVIYTGAYKLPSKQSVPK